MVGRNLVDLARERGLSIVAPTSRELDLRDYAAAVTYLSSVRPDVVIHAAGRVGGIQANIREPAQFLVDNFDLGRNLVLATREARIAKLINLGSSCMYPRNRQTALREDDLLTGKLEPTNEGYAIAKIAIARLCQYISRESPGFSFKTIIPCNIYGPYDTFDPIRSHLVPAVIHKLHLAKVSRRREVEVWGDGAARREFMHAADLAEAILRAVDQFDSLPDLMNVGTGLDYSVDDYYSIAARVVGYQGAFLHDAGKPVGMARKLLDVSRARQWGWSARIGLEEGLQNTYQYYLSRSGTAS